MINEFHLARKRLFIQSFLARQFTQPNKSDESINQFVSGRADSQFQHLAKFSGISSPHPPHFQ